MESKIRICAAVVLAVLLAVLGVYFITPYYIVVPDGEEIRVEYVVSKLTVLDMTSTAEWETTEYSFFPGGEGYAGLVEALESVSYRNCFRTLSGTTYFSDIGYIIYVWLGDECYSFYDRGYLIADKIYYVSKNSIENIRSVIM